MKKVLVLMSAYNGENYIEEQLDSIFSQEGVDVYCLVRDDGSKDSTREIIESFAKANHKLTFCFGENIGWAKSFYSLVERSRESDYDYYAFCDQDDKWDAQKILAAAEKLDKEDKDKPLLYCSNLKIVDDNLNWSGKLRFDRVDISKKHALAESFATGCTQVFNNKAKELFLSYKPDYLHAHDYWLYLICIFTGRVIYDENAYINYRQHHSNVIGGEITLKELIRRRLRFFSGDYLKKKLNQHPKEYMAREILKGFRSYLIPEDIKIIEAFALYRENIWRRLYLFFNFKIYKISFYQNIEFRISIILGMV